jgi:GDP/UDP-N,N'-diacetylbacillosamine 2-epimerase (hydrolysing)
MIKRILVASVARSDFSITQPVINKFTQSKKFIVSKIISTTNYLDEGYETGSNQFNKDDFLIPNNLKNDSPEQVNQVISNIIKQSSKIFYKFKPDLLILTGDRYEMLSMAVASISGNLPIAHIHGGETSLGSFDEQSRHSITKLSHIHFPATKNAAKKIQKMGEPIKNITLAGAPALDGFLSKKRSKEESFLRLTNKFKIDLSDEIILITFHPVTIDIDNEMSKLNTIFDVLSKFKNKLIFTSPGADPKYKIIMDKIQNFINKNKNAIFVKSFGDQYYYDILNVW